MPPKFHGFNVEEPSSTRVDIPMPMGEDPGRHGLISEYKPNLIDKIGNLVPDTGVGGVLKGLYRGTDQNLLGMLPSGRYESVSPEISTGKAMSFIADPIAGAKSLKYAVSGGTPLSRLIANSIQPTSYSNKLGEVKRVLSDKKLFKEAVIDDIPQYKLPDQMEDRLFAWRTKLGLGEPNPKYNQSLDMRRYENYKIDKSDYHRAVGFELRGKKGTELTSGQYLERMKGYEQDTPIDRLWNKFGTHVEDGKKYHHYKNPEDYFSAKSLSKTSEAASRGHGLFGGYTKNIRSAGKDIVEDYYDNWDFAFNKPLRKGNYNFSSNKKAGWPVLVQRGLAETLLNPLEFKGTAKKIYRKPNPGWNISDPYSW